MLCWYIRLHWFLSCSNKNLDTEPLVAQMGPQTSYRSVIAQRGRRQQTSKAQGWADRRAAPVPLSSSFYTCYLLPLDPDRLCPMQNRVFTWLATPRTNQERSCVLLACCCSVTKSCQPLWDPLKWSTSAFPALHCLPEFAQTHVRWVSDAIQQSHPLPPPSLLVLNLSQHEGLLESALCIRWPKYWSFSFSISLSNEYSGLISSRIDLFELAIQGTCRSLLQHHSSKVSILQCSAFFIVQLSHVHMATGKTIALTKWAFAGKVMSLLFNTLSRLFVIFLPWSKCLLSLWLHSPSTVILEPKKIKSVTISALSPIICHKVMGLDVMIFVFWMLSFEPTFSHFLSSSSRDFLVPLGFNPLEWYHVRIWGCWYFSWQSWFQVVIHPSWHSLVAQRLNCLPAMWETWFRSLGWEDPLEKETATPSSILAWRIPWMEEPGGLQSTGSQRVWHDWETSLSLSLCKEVK